MSIRPSVRAPRPWSFPRPVRGQLDNGLQVLTFHRPGQHVVSATVVLDLPLTVEPPAVEGVSAMVQRILDEGTHAHPGTDFADQLEGQGAVLSGGTSHVATHVSVEVPNTRLAAALPLFAESMIEPALTDDDVARHVDLRLAEIEQQLAHPGHRGGQAFRAAVTAEPFRSGRPAAGSTPTVSSITGESVRAHHAAHYGPGRATLILAGDLADDPMEMVQTAFGAWTGPGQGADHETPAGAAPRAIIIDRPGAVQADVRMGGFGVDRLHPDWAAIRMGCHAVGGAFLSRLNRVLREERGYTYGVQLINTPSRSGGLLALHGSFRTAVAAAAVAEARELIRLDGERRLTEPEIADAVNFTIGVTPLRYATAGGVTDQVAALTEAGIGVDFVDAHTAALQRVTAESATVALEPLLRPDRLSLVVVGDADTLAGPLADQGWPLEVVTD